MITEDDVRHTAKLARLSLTPEEVSRYTEQMGRILAFFDELAAIDTAGVPETSHPVPVANALRDDVPRPSLPLEALLANAPHREGEFFRVPKILDA